MSDLSEKELEGLPKKLLDQVPDEVEDDWSVVLPAGDIRLAARAIRQLMGERDAKTQECERANAVILAMADDGWLMHGEEGMDAAQQQVWDYLRTTPQYRARHAAKGHDGHEPGCPDCAALSGKEQP